MIWFLYFIFGIVVGGFCAWLANEKNRSFPAWFALGFLFGPLALLTLIGAPPLVKAASQVGQSPTLTTPAATGVERAGEKIALEFD